MNISLITQKLKLIKKVQILFVGIVLFFAMNSSLTLALDELTINMQSIAANQEKAASIGSIVLKDSKYGLLFETDLKNLPPGPSTTLHTLRIYPNADCSEHGNKAGAKPLGYEEEQLNYGPYDNRSALGILPNLIVDVQGVAKVQILAPRLKIKNITNTAIVIHTKADIYNGESYISGDSSARIACGIITEK